MAKEDNLMKKKKKIKQTKTSLVLSEAWWPSVFRSYKAARENRLPGALL